MIYMKSLKILGLDLDGTLVKMKLDFKTIRQEMGISKGDTLSYIRSLPEMEAKRLESILSLKEMEAAELAEISPGAMPLIEYCRENDIKIVIITRNSEEAARRTLEIIGLEVDMVVSREHADPKPSPEGINLVLGHFDIKPHEMAYVGDFLYDIQAGNSAGVKTILIASDDIKEQWGPMANYVASDLGEVLDIMITGRR